MNQLCVAKFGGTSVANADAMSRCAQVVVNNPKTRVVVLSASAGVTNLLVDLSQGTLDVAAREDRLQRLTDIHFHILDALGQPAALTQTIRDMLDEVRDLSAQATVATDAALVDRMVAQGELMSGAKERTQPGSAYRIGTSCSVNL